jgi:tetratricopeptide (TPR) repeat protein
MRAVAAGRAAIRLQPDSAEAHTNLGIALGDLGKTEEAIAAYREAIRLKPDLAEAHTNLGIALYRQGKLAEAIAAYREAVRLKPDYAPSHTNLGIALYRQGKLAEAIAAYREAVRLKPDNSRAHAFLGGALIGQGKPEEAIAELREAVRLEPDLANAHSLLGRALISQGKPEEAIPEYRRALELAPPGSTLSRDTQNRIRETEQQISLAPRLPDVLKGEHRPKDAAEALLIAYLCHYKGLYAAAARLWAEALLADPKLANDRQKRHRYNAACAAALAGCGRGKDDPPPDESARTRLRQQALDWLKAELAAWSGMWEKGPSQAGQEITRKLRHWKVDPDLAGVRDPEALARLPEPERRRWQALWAAVDELLNLVSSGRARPIAQAGTEPPADPFAP